MSEKTIDELRRQHSHMFDLPGAKNNEVRLAYADIATLNRAMSEFRNMRMKNVRSVGLYVYVDADEYFGLETE